MSAFKSAIAAAVLLAIPAVRAEGFTIQNSCSFSVFYKVTTDYDSPVQEVAPGQSSSMPYTQKSDGGGPSVKVGNSQAVNGNILQMEYTKTASMLFYDISNIDGLPFGPHNVQLSTNKDCPSVTCVAGQTCSQAYNVPSDNQATKACPLSGTDTTLTLCSDETSGSVADAVSGAVSDAVGGVAAAVNNAVPVTVETPAAQPQVNNAPAPAPTTLSTSVVAAPAPTQAPVAAQDDSAPIPVRVSAAPANPASNVAEEDFNALHFPASWGKSFWSEDKDVENNTKAKRSSRIHRHHAHLAARDSS